MLADQPIQGTRTKTMRKLIFLIGIFALILTFQAHATVVRSMNLEEIVADAQYVVKVKVLEKSTEDESGRIVTYWTFAVLDWIKGSPTADNELVIKQIGQGQFTVDGYSINQNLFFPEYEVGKTYLLFLPEAHSETGMLAPVGLHQGVFEVREVDGQDYVPQLTQRVRSLKARLPQNKKFRTLGRNLDAASKNPSYSNFKSMIESVGGK